MKFQIKSLCKNQSTDLATTRALLSSAKKLWHWMDGWMGGWMEGKAGLRIAYSNKKQALKNN